MQPKTIAAMLKCVAALFYSRPKSGHENRGTEYNKISFKWDS